MPGKRVGRPPLTERRKHATRMDIAREAVHLFTTNGVAATSADQIAEAAGVSTRTLWRYFPGAGKENCVRPLLTAGIEAIAQALSDPAGELPDRLATEPGDVDTMLALVRLTRTEPAVRAVWLQAHHDAEPVFATSIAERSGRRPDDLAVKVEAAVLNAALRVAVEHCADHAPDGDPAPALWDALRSALRVAGTQI